VFDERGTLINFVGVQHDITEQVQSQQALELANRAANLANEAKSAFLATMSHELRTPLTAVLGFADMLRSESDQPDYLDKVETIKRNGQYLLALLNDVLDLSKIEAGKLDIDQEVIDILAVTHDVQSLMQIRATEAGIPLRFEYKTKLPREVTADEVRVRQILVNLISNAIKFTNAGEVLVTVELRHELQPPMLSISVKDTGIGITPEQQARLFTPFNQATQETTKRFGGTGLGLSISKRLAEGMGGMITVQSEVGVGSEFTFSLPVSEIQVQSLVPARPATTAPSEAAANAQAARPALPKIDGRILLADDRRDVWRIGKYFLEKCGAEVTIVEDGRQALDAVQRAQGDGNPFDLILMDMQMPVMTGREAVAAIRDLRLQIPIIALTADAMDGEREACLAMGCDEYFPKPIDGPRLMNLIASFLNESSISHSNSGSC
ncbi:MAG: ATP-binding protein, partial [Planctomycetaceae bacterium]